MARSETSSGTSAAGSRRPIRWWPAVVILVIAVVALVTIWLFLGRQRQDKVVLTFPVLFFTPILLLLWALFLSRLRWRVRLAVLGCALVVAAAVLSTVRIRGVSGDLIPVVAWRWAPPPGGLLDTGTAARASPGLASEPVMDPRRDYPQFLGPWRNGTLSGIELSRDWSAKPPALLWRQPIGAAWSGFAVQGELAVTQEQRGSEELVTCYEVGTGRLLWAHADPVRYENPVAGIGPRATPTIDDGRVYAVGATGILNALDLVTGELLWSKNLLEDSGAHPPTYGVAASPLVIEDLVVVAPGGSPGHSLVAYRKDTGEKVWAGGSDPPAYSSPLLAELAGVRQILIFNEAGLAAHDPATGEVLWRHPWPGQTERISQPVVLPGDRVFLSSGYGIGGKLFRVRRDDGGGVSVELLWESRGLKAKFTDVVYGEGYLYGLDDGILVCLDPEDGRRRWKRGRYGHGQVIRVDDLLIVQAESGDVVLVEASPERHRELARLSALDGKTWNHPALAGRRLLVRNDREAACYVLPAPGGPADAKPS